MAGVARWCPRFAPEPKRFDRLCYRVPGSTHAFRFLRKVSSEPCLRYWCLLFWLPISLPPGPLCRCCPSFPCRPFHCPLSRGCLAYGAPLPPWFPTAPALLPLLKLGPGLPALWRPCGPPAPGLLVDAAPPLLAVCCPAPGASLRAYAVTCKPASPQDQQCPAQCVCVRFGKRMHRVKSGEFTEEGGIS